MVILIKRIKEIDLFDPIKPFNPTLRKNQLNPNNLIDLTLRKKADKQAQCIVDQYTTSIAFDRDKKFAVLGKGSLFSKRFIQIFTSSNFSSIFPSKFLAANYKFWIKI